MCWNHNVITMHTKSATLNADIITYNVHVLIKISKVHNKPDNLKIKTAASNGFNANMKGCFNSR